jgi:hypothetical protein
MTLNYMVVLLTGIVPLITGFIWYSGLFGKAWAKATGKTVEELKAGFKPIVVFPLTILFGILAAMLLGLIVIHQGGMFSMVMDNPDFGKEGSEVMNDLNMMMSKYGNNFRTFKHGMLHGFSTGLCLALPILGINAFFERTNFKLVWINVGYWTFTFMIMGGIICQWA